MANYTICQNQYQSETTYQKNNKTYDCLSSSECTEESGMEVPRKTVLKVKGQGQVQSVATVENSMIKSLQNPPLDQKQSLLMSPLQGGE